MRVIAGSARGRRLVAPDGRDTRPTGDRVRESVFNALASMGVIEGASVLDLFAGSGALAIEALSRGAAHADLVESDRRAAKSIEHNLAATGLADRATVVTGTAERFLDRARSEGRHWDVALLDPPYAFDGWSDLLAGLPASLAVVESARQVPAPPGWRMLRERRYGTTLVTLLDPIHPDGPPTATAPPE